MVGSATHASTARREHLLLVGLDRLHADGLLELEDEPGADRLDDRRGAALLAVGLVVEVAVLGRVDVHHRAAAGHDRHPVGHQLAAHDEHARGAGAADELVRADEDRVLARAAGAVHLDVDVGRAGGEVPEAERAVLVEQVGDALGVGDDAGDVGGGGEGADLERPVGVALELLAEVVEGDPAVGVLVDGDDVGDGLAPADLVGVVLEGADEDDRTLVGGDRARSGRSGRRAPPGSAGRGCRSACRSPRCCRSRRRPRRSRRRRRRRRG